MCLVGLQVQLAEAAAIPAELMGGLFSGLLLAQGLCHGPQGRVRVQKDNDEGEGGGGAVWEERGECYEKGGGDVASKGGDVASKVSERGCCKWEGML